LHRALRCAEDVIERRPICCVAMDGRDGPQAEAHKEMAPQQLVSRRTSRSSDTRVVSHLLVPLPGRLGCV